MSATGRRRTAGWLLLALVGLAAVFAPWLSTGDYTAQHPDLPLAPPSLSPLRMVERLPPTYLAAEEPRALAWFDGGIVRSADPQSPLLPLGSDSLGRDQWSRLLHGARLSLGLACAGLAGSLLLGIVVGLIAGERGGWMDSLLMRTADMLIAWPVLYVVLVLRAALPLSLSLATTFLLMAGVLTLAGWPIVARAVRAVTVSERTRDYVVAARAAGASRLWVGRRHLLPAVMPVVMTKALLLIPSFILAEATLSFVGLGIPEPAPSWGTMLRETSSAFVLLHAPWLLIPAAAIAIVTLAVNLIADAGESDG
jgi:peptide/nickel transport system permease protein